MRILCLEFWRAPSLPPHRTFPHPPGPHSHPDVIDNADAAAAALNEDPAPFEAELAAREAALGPEHVDVAESLSNLAILYNQKGDMG